MTSLFASLNNFYEKQTFDFQTASRHGLLFIYKIFSLTDVVFEFKTYSKTNYFLLPLILQGSTCLRRIHNFSLFRK